MELPSCVPYHLWSGHPFCVSVLPQSLGLFPPHHQIIISCHLTSCRTDATLLEIKVLLVIFWEGSLSNIPFIVAGNKKQNKQKPSTDMDTYFPWFSRPHRGRTNTPILCAFGWSALNKQLFRPLAAVAS